MKIKLLEGATTPTRSHPTDAGLDLYALEDVVLWPGMTEKVRTGVCVSIPDGHVGLIKDRSSVGSKGIQTLAGVIDQSYRGEISIVMQNTNSPVDFAEEHMGNLTYKVTAVKAHDNIFQIKKGSKIAQMLVVPINCVDVEIVDSLDETERGENGFGSTGE